MRSRFDTSKALALACVGLLLLPSLALAGPYSQLQVLLPGETAAPGTVSGKTGSPIAQSVGVPFTLRVRACDDQWATATDITNVISLSSTDAEATLPPDATLVAGELALTVTLNAAGSFTVSADDQSDGTIPTATSATVTVQTLAGFEFQTISQKHRYAGQPFSTTITAVGPTGERASGYSGPVRLQELTSFGPGRIVPEVVTLSQGYWAGEVTVFRADETDISSGNANMYVYLESDPTKNGTSNPFVVHPGSLARLLLVLPGQRALPGSITGLTGSPATQAANEPFTVDVQATDAYWNPLPATHSVRLTSSDPAASTPVDGVLVDGYDQLTVRLGTFGAQTLTISDRTSGSIQGMTSAPIQVISGGARSFAIEGLPATTTAGETVAVTIRATDGTGNTVSDFQGDALLAANTGAGSISPESISFVNGVWSGDMVFRGAGGAVQFTCSDYASPPHFGTSPAFQVQPAAYAGLQVLMPGQAPQGGTADGVEGSPDDQAAGGQFTIQVRAVDAFFNRVPGVTNRIELTSTDLNIAAPTEPALVNGEVSIPVTLYRAGYQTVSASDLDNTEIATGHSDQVQVTPGTYARLLVVAPGESVSPGAEEGRSGAATDQSINFAFTVRVHATDQWFNPIGGITDVVRLTSNDPLAELPADAPLVDGVVLMNVRLSTGGYQQITASNVTQPSILPSTTQVRAITSGLHLQAEITPTTVKAGEQFTLTVAVTNDAGAVIQEINTAVNVEVRHATTQEPGRGALENTSFQLLQGQRTIVETYTYAEPIVLIVSDDAGNEPAVTEVLTVTPGNPARIEVSSDPVWARTNHATTINAHVFDAFDNGVPNRLVTFRMDQGDGHLQLEDADPAKAVSDTTNAAGAVQVAFLAPADVEDANIEVSSGSIIENLPITVAKFDPDAPVGSITNYPNPFRPDEHVETQIEYVLAADMPVRMRIYTLSGGLVVDRGIEAGGQGGQQGHNTLPWDGLNDNGKPVASGGYILFIEAEGVSMRRKIGVVR